MPLKNLFLVIFITILLTSTFYANLDNLIPFFQKITGYTSIVLYGTVESPQANTGQENTLAATVQQPQKEEPTQIQSQETSQTTAVVEPKQEKKDYVNQTILFRVINQTEELQGKLKKLRTSSLTVLDFYSSVNDTTNVEKWVNIVTLFNQALDDLKDIQNYTESVKDSATKENVSVIKGVIIDVLKILYKILELIK